MINKDHKSRSIHINLCGIEDLTNLIFRKTRWLSHLILSESFIELIGSDSFLIFCLQDRNHFKKVFESIPIECRDRHDRNMFGKIKVRLSTFDHRIDHLWLYQIRLVETKDHRQPQARHLFEQGQISMRNPLRTVNHKKHHGSGIFKHCIGLVISDFFDTVCFSFFSDSCGIIHRISLPLRLKFSNHIISRRPKLIFDFSELFSYKRIEKCRFSCIWLTHNRKSDPTMRWRLNGWIVLIGFSPLSVELCDFIFKFCKIPLSLRTNSNHSLNS